MKLRHDIQLAILRHLLFQPGSRFSDMKPTAMEGSKFTFHLDALLTDKLVTKSTEGTYSLTGAGKEEANRYDFEASLPRLQAKMSAVFCCHRTGTDEWLIYERRKEPYFGAVGFPTGKVRYGETFAEAAERELTEETGLRGTARLHTVQHFLVRHAETHELLEDKCMGICIIENPEGILEPGAEGHFCWAKLDSDTTPKVLPEFLHIQKLLQQEQPVPLETLLTTSFF